MLIPLHRPVQYQEEVHCVLGNAVKNGLFFGVDQQKGLAFILNVFPESLFDETV